MAVLLEELTEQLPEQTSTLVLAELVQVVEVKVLEMELLVLLVEQEAR